MASCDDCGSDFHVREVTTPNGTENQCFDCRENGENPLRGTF